MVSPLLPELKLTSMIISVHFNSDLAPFATRCSASLLLRIVQDLSFNGLKLLAVELILRLVFWFTDNGASYELKLTGIIQRFPLL
ncbi:MAG TPA: hypothetical protein DEG17_18840 [Cyanobacteria bacterium UBA11149]|nr:hypothetical protein [Cyanobacteria bacterium UBA11366]HBK65732.1 hypothetical protein [Cyanobacteria bacterium UBA11166]HBW90868.1 hypothetical protein [Cyanobacteria bacterium UBA11149]